MSKDYYEVLGVPKTASAEEIKTAFRKKAHQHHPDKGGDAEKFKELNEAYQVLGNETKRHQYDQFGSSFQNGQAGGGNPYGAGFNQGGFDFSGFQNGGIDMDDLFGGFGDIFGFGGGGRSRRGGAKRGQDMEMTLNLDFMEAAFGGEHEISYDRVGTCSHCHGTGGAAGAKLETCPTCQGRGKITQIQRTILGNIQTQSTCPDCEGVGQRYDKKCSFCHGTGTAKETAKFKVKIPAGIDDGESIRLSGQGGQGEKGASAGDLYLRIKIRPQTKFNRDGYDVKNSVEISFSLAALGGKVEVATIHGPLTLKIPEGTQSGTVFKLKDKGIPKLKNSGFGNHYATVIVKTPVNLNRQQKQLLQEMNL
jgi:molecular chaperone DnaJ